MSARASWDKAQPAEVIPKRLTWRENVAMALGLAVVILFIRLWRLLPKS
jgi:hypothetical protein